MFRIAGDEYAGTGRDVVAHAEPVLASLGLASEVEALKSSVRKEAGVCP
jgi:hypothetical protein